MASKSTYEWQSNSFRFFSDMTEAIKARLLAEQKYYGEFAPQKHLYEKFIDKGGGHN